MVMHICTERLICKEKKHSLESVPVHRYGTRTHVCRVMASLQCVVGDSRLSLAQLVAVHADKETEAKK